MELALKGSQLMAKVIKGVKFVNGELEEAAASISDLRKTLNWRSPETQLLTVSPGSRPTSESRYRVAEMK